MTKSEFLELFANNDRIVHIRMALNYDEFLENETIIITEETVSTLNLLDFYVPKYEKYGEYDRSHYAKQVVDHEVKPLTIKQVLADPKKWDLEINHAERLSIEQLNSFPVATDTKSGRTLLLDSNHVVVNALSELKQSHLDAITLKVVSVRGINLEAFIPDFKILNRVR
jgi:hypothetical protein